MRGEAISRLVNPPIISARAARTIVIANPDYFLLSLRAKRSNLSFILYLHPPSNPTPNPSSPSHVDLNRASGEDLKPG
jgi:hypothetical protein